MREGAKAMLTGSIDSLGTHYVITLSAVNAQTGDVLAREESEAESKEQVLKSLDQAASSLRSKLGESIGSVQKFATPLEQATTSSLEALQAFSLGQAEHLRLEDARPFPTSNAPSSSIPTSPWRMPRWAWLTATSRRESWRLLLSPRRST
jgi:hypothetical protein